MAAAKGKKAPKISKADFVRRMPKDMPAKEVAEKAAAEGIKLTDKYVYVIRSQDNRSAAKKGKKKVAKAGVRSVAARAGRGGKRQAASTGPDTRLEAQLRQAIADCGLVRSREILTEVESTFAGQ